MDLEAAPEPEPPTACEQAWSQFGAINDFQDSLEDAVPTLFACSDVDEWVRVGKDTPGHSLIVARATAKNLCRFQPGTKTAPVCTSL